jgi:hypothetical protein
MQELSILLVCKFLFCDIVPAMPKPKHKEKREGPRNVVSVPLYEREEAIVIQFITETGMSKIEFFSRLLKFFSTQEDVIQRQILGINAKSIEVDIAELMLRKIAERKSGAAHRLSGGNQKPT